MVPLCCVCGHVVVRLNHTVIAYKVQLRIVINFGSFVDEKRAVFIFNFAFQISVRISILLLG